MAQKLDRSYFGTGNRKTATGTNKKDTSGAAKSVQKLDRSHFNKPKSAPISGASPAKTTVPQTNNTNTDAWTRATASQTKIPEKKGGSRSSGTAMQGTTVNERGFSGSSRKLDKPTFAERVGKTISGGAKGSAASNINAMATMYDMGQGGRSARDAETMEEYSHSLERAKLDMNAMLDENKKNPGSWSAHDIQIQQNIIDDWQRKYDAMAKVKNEQIQQKATRESYKIADSVQRSSERDIARAKEGAGFVGELLIDSGASNTQTALDWAANAIMRTPGSMLPFAMRAFGGATQQARQDNPDSTLTQQALFGTASAAKEVISELMFNIPLLHSKAYGKGALDDIVTRGIRNAVEKFAKTEAGKKALGSAMTFGAGAVGEGLEELIGDWMEWQLPRIYGGDVATAQETLSNSLYDFLVGATSGAMGGVISPNTYRYDLGTAQAAQQGAQERTDVQDGTRAAPAQTNAQAQQETAQRAIQGAVQRQTDSNPVSAEEQVLRQREAAVQKTFTGIADKLGDSGRKAFQAAYQGTDRGAYTGEFLRAYHAGMTNQENPNSTSAVSFAAYAAGQNDAAASLAREKRTAQFAKTAGTDSGLVFDDYVSREMDSAVADEVNTVSKALGVRTRMVDQVLGGLANGDITGSDVMIAKDAVDPVLQVVGHEWTHRVQELAPEQYRAFRDAVTSIPDVQEAAQILLEQYNRHGVETSYEQALDEATANYAGEMIANSDVLDDFIRKHSGNRTLLQKLRDAIHEIVGKLTGRAKRQAQTVEGKLQAAFEAASKQAENLEDKNTATEGGETRYSIGEIEGNDKKKYGVGVHLDSTLLENLTPKERTEMVKERIKELGGEVFTAYDQNGNAVDITIAKPEARFTNRNGKKIAVNKDLATKYIGNETKQEAVVLVDELIETAKFDKSKAPLYSHDWLDNNGKSDWDYWTTFIQDKNGIIWEATLNVANAASGEKILYDISPIKKVGQSVKSDTSLLSNSISQSRENVNENFSLKGTENAQEIAALKRENDTLKERVEYWKSQTRRTQQATTDKMSVAKAADALVKDYGASIKGSEIASDLQSLYDYIASGKDGKDELTYTEARRRSDAIAEKIAESAVEVDDRAYKEYANLRKFLKDTKLTLTAQDAAEITDFNELRKSQFGKVKFGTGKHTNVDQIYSELAEQYPEFFSEQRDMNISDQVQRIADVANRLYKVTEYNPFEGYMGQAVASISNDIMDRFFDLPQTKKTFADRAAEQLQATRAAGKQAAQDAFLAGQMAQGRQDTKRLRSTAQALAKERTRRAEQVQALKNRYREKDVTRRDNQKRRELRAKIVRHASALSQKLLRPTDNQHIPEDMRSAVAKVLESINQESSPNARSFTLDPVTKERIYKEKGEPTNRTVAFQNLKEQYQKIAKEGDMVVDPSLLGDEDVPGGFSEVIKMGDTRLADLTTEQLKTMWNVLKSVEHSVTTAGKTLASEKFATTKQFADALRMDGMTRRQKLGNNVAISLETPYTFFAHFGQTGKDIYRMLRNAQDHQEIMARDVAEKVHQILGDAKTGIRENAVTSMNEEVHHFTTTEGRELTLTTAQAMELYLLSERKQAEDHLLKGGIMQPEIKIPGKTKIPRGTNAIHLSAADIQNIVGVLTPEQIRIADGLQKLTTGVLANYGNEASMKAYGYKKFTEQDYWPIKSAEEDLNSSPEKDNGNVRSIKNIGMAQAVNPKASNALEVRSVFSTFADHASDMIDYAAWLCPMEDANRLFNYKFEDGKGKKTGVTVKGFLKEKGGEGSQKYWQKLMGDIQNGIGEKDFEPLSNLAIKPIGWFKAAAVGANLRVVIQQPTAFFRASAVLDPADMARGLTGGVTKGNGWEKALTHSPIAMRKDVGSFDISSPYTLNDRFYGKEGIANKINEKAGAPAGKADAVTWGALWNACEWQVKRERPNLRAGSGEFYSAVNDVFTDMIDQTQVVDGILQRSNIMRGHSDLAKQATSFMGEPIMSLNVFMRAWDNMHYEENPAKRSKAIKTVGRAAAALLVTDVVNAIAQSIMDANRDDDPDKDYWEKLWTAFWGLTGNEENALQRLRSVVIGGNLGSNVNKVGSVPFAKDILSIISGYGVTRTDMEVWEDIITASKSFIDSMGDNGQKTRPEALANVIAAGAKIAGLPVSNLKRELVTTVRTAIQATGNVAIEYEYEKLFYNIYSTSNKDRYMGLAFKALEQGDLTTYEHIRKELKDYMAVDSTSVDSGMQNRLEKKQEKDGDYRLPQNAASLIGAKDSYDDSEGEDKFTENDLSSDDYIVYSRRKSELYSSMESGLKNSQTFQNFTGKQKDKALSSLETYAKKTTLQSVAGSDYEITDKWILKAQEAEKKYRIKPEVYIALKTQVSDLKSVKDRNGETIPNSKGLLIMQAIYNTPGLSEAQRNALFEYLGVGKSIRHYNKALVNEKVRKNARLAGK